MVPLGSLLIIEIDKVILLVWVRWGGKLWIHVCTIKAIGCEKEASFVNPFFRRGMVVVFT